MAARHREVRHARPGAARHVVRVHLGLRRRRLELGVLAKARPAVSIGSYPAMTPDGFRNRIVVRSRDAQALAEARNAVEALVARLTA